jgi:acetyl esterase/lipase
MEFIMKSPAVTAAASVVARANGPWLTKSAMHWFWNAYAPNLAERAQITASALRAMLEQLQALPPALVITARMMCCATKPKPTRGN